MFGGLTPGSRDPCAPTKPYINPLLNQGVDGVLACNPDSKEDTAVCLWK